MRCSKTLEGVDKRETAVHKKIGEAKYIIGNDESVREVYELSTTFTVLFNSTLIGTLVHSITVLVAHSSAEPSTGMCLQYCAVYCF